MIRPPTLRFHLQRERVTQFFDVSLHKPLGFVAMLLRCYRIGKQRRIVQCLPCQSRKAETCIKTTMYEPDSGTEELFTERQFAF
jgi:hypothetical protein